MSKIIPTDHSDDETPSPHFWPGRLDVAFVFSAPGTFEAEYTKPIQGATGRNLDAALLHLTQALSSIFPSPDRYDYRITNAYAPPISHALGHRKTEADDAEITRPSNLKRVLDELIGCRIVILCGNKAHLLRPHLSEFDVVLAGHTSLNGLNTRWPDTLMRGDIDGWDAFTGAQRTAHRIRLWVQQVERQCRSLPSIQLER